jgi:putative membrane protein
VKINPKNIGIVLVIVHLVGVVGLLSPYKKYFLTLTPYTLLLSGIVLFAFDEQKKFHFWAFGALCFGLGMAAEAIGVNTGYLFGDYRYGKVLGLKWQNVPLLIGWNWWMLSYVSAHYAEKAYSGSVWRGAIGAAIMVAWDYLIEPVAIHLKFWTWQTVSVPVFNYICWFLVSLPLQWVAQKWKIARNNPMAFWFLLSQVLFFTLLSLLKK